MGARRENSGSTHVAGRWIGGPQSLQAAQVLLPVVQQGMRRRSVRSQTVLVRVGVLAVPAVRRRRRTCWRWPAGCVCTNERRRSYQMEMLLIRSDRAIIPSGAELGAARRNSPGPG
jgi:hypothetical protein